MTDIMNQWMKEWMAEWLIDGLRTGFSFPFCDWMFDVLANGLFVPKGDCENEMKCCPTSYKCITEYL